ncbi:MAG TPA: class I SAM-dependent methyltransferase [Spirochaetota bacterium]|nr:class I SAM-dependent methyltransferase [Spirochaetota bacterium]HOS31858.1 class I SAM-dependent methyltransferase [Spirochaetota bacterium]HOS56134.1 class I SAM-dependent methyltransferase [Spirochaetota bacterium]HPK60865.1 class I SAM-dependent methyltransferase [Spirochaetota bacterium]HQF76677.1 class I SAM-dependent methyltransferase [Spirochaetota bacterium]
MGFLDKYLIDQLVKDAEDVWPKRWSEIESSFQKITLSAAVDIIIWDLSLFSKKGDTGTYSDMKNTVGITPDNEYVFKKLLDILVEENILSREGEVYVCVDNDPEIHSPIEYIAEAVRDIPEEWAAFQWLARGIGGLKRFIKGKLSGEEAMFGPWGDFTLVGQVYYTSEVYGYWSKLAGKTVTRLINNVFDRKITVLEIGAGTGGGTTDLFKSLGEPRNKIEKYIFTDIHKRLVKKSSKNFEEYFDFMEFKGLDVTLPLEEQEVDLESADLLYAVNVMHATNNILSACSAMYKLIKKGGYAVLGEIAPPKDKLYRYMELTFGLLSSYSYYEDKELRPLSPILRPEQWIEYFKKAGFRDAIAIPGDRLPGCDRGGAIIAIK